MAWPRFGVARPYTRRKRESGIVRTRDGFFGVFHRLHGENRTEGLFLKKFHRGIYAGDDGRLKEICAKIGAGFSAAQNSRPARYRIVDQIAHALHVLRTNQRTNVGRRIASGTEPQLFRFLDTQRKKLFLDGLVPRKAARQKDTPVRNSCSCPKRRRSRQLRDSHRRGRSSRPCRPVRARSESIFWRTLPRRAGPVATLPVNMILSGAASISAWPTSPPP